MVTEHQVAVSRHQRETVLAETRKMAERQQQEYGLMARRRRLTVTAIDLPGPTSDLRHNQLLQQILKYEAVFDSLKLATHSHDKQVTLIVVYLSLCLSCPVLSCPVLSVYLSVASLRVATYSQIRGCLEYCNSLYRNWPKSQITRLQQIENSLASAVVKAPKSGHITPILRSLHRSLPFLLHDSTNSPDCLPILLSISTL